MEDMAVPYLSVHIYLPDGQMADTELYKTCFLGLVELRVPTLSLLFVKLPSPV